MTDKLSLKISHEQLPLKSVFRIARGAKTQADVIVVTLKIGQFQGSAESVPYARYKESIENVTTAIKQLPTDSLEALTQAVKNMPAGAARNAVDCALWDLKAKQQGTSVAALLKLKTAKECVCAQTLSIDTPENMAKAVSELNHPPLVKVKLDNIDIIEKMTAINQAAPHSRFIVDANEGWSIEDLKHCHQALHELNVVLIEQPLPAAHDHQLQGFDCKVPLCADESCHTSADLERLQGSYQVVNIKLDKTGGLTEAYQLAQKASEQGFKIMLGCMVGSSLAMAPASLLTDLAQFVDLDGPLLIAKDREYGFTFEQGVMQPLDGRLWGE